MFWNIKRSTALGCKEIESESEFGVKTQFLEVMFRYLNPTEWLNDLIQINNHIKSVQSFYIQISVTKCPAKEFLMG